MFSSGNINSFITLTNILILCFNFISMTTSRRLITNSYHYFLPLFTMRLNVISINTISNKMSSFVTHSVIDKSITVLM